MAKLRDTAVKDNLNIAGRVVAGGKVLSVEGHTHTPANITGLDTYINQKIQASGGGTGGSGTPVVPSGDINAKTLDGHPVSDFVLKTEASGSIVYSYSKIVNFTSNSMMITIPESFGDYLIKITDLNSEKYLKNDTFFGKVIKFTNFPDIYGYSQKTPIWGANSNKIAIYGIIPNSNKIKIEVYSNRPITKEIDISSTIVGSFNYYFFIVDKSTYSHLGYKIHDANVNLVTPPKLIKVLNSTPHQYNDLCIYGDTKIVDLDNNITFRVYNSSIYSYNPNNIPLVAERAYGLGGKMIYYVRGLSNNIVVVHQNGFVYYTDHTASQNANITKDSGDNATSEFSIVNVKKILGSSSSGDVNISATINGVQFDGKTNITTPASKLITPVHINGVEFDGSRDITIPAPTNALTLGGLDSSQYIKATDVGNAAGKIPKFDNEGFLVYPDGSKERIENA